MEPKAELELRKQVERQVENVDWDKIMVLAKQKEAAFAGIISEEGAIHIALNELHPEFKLSATKISGADVKGRLVNKTKPRLIDTEKMKNQVVRDVYVATEEMGVLKSTLWGKSQVELFKGIEHGDPIICSGVKIDTHEGESIIRFFKNSNVEKIDEGDVNGLQGILGTMVISKVKTSEVGVVKGLVLTAGTVKFDSCPECGARLTEVEGTFLCKKHGEVRPQHKEAIELTIDASGTVFSSMLWPEMIGEGVSAPKQFDVVSLVCRAYDGNHYAREKAKKESEASLETIDKQFPRDMRVTVYSYEILESKAPTKKRAAPSNDAPINVDDIEEVS